MTKANEAYRHLAEMIETGVLTPGEIVTEARLVELVGIGRTPMREAVHRLDRDHLVRLRGGRGIEIPSISVDDQIARLEVRRSMEVLAVGLACARATEDQLEDLRTHAEEIQAIQEIEPYVESVRRSHELLRTAANNEYLADALTPLQGLSRRFWLANITDPTSEVRQGKALYVPALQALVERDATGARQRTLQLNDHLMQSALAVAARRAGEGRDFAVV